MLRTAAVLLGIGATVGSALDALHTHGGVTSYPNPVAFKMAWWTPGIFGLAGLGTGLAYPLVESYLGKSITAPLTPQKVAVGMGVFTGLYALTGFSRSKTATKLAIVGAGAAALGLTLAPTREAALTALAASVIGPIVEINLVKRGLFTHHESDWKGIPMWLPALYATGSIAFGVAGKWIHAELSRAEAK
ncbi:MAG: hypothetical protein U0271_01800 [Polyangiaceae bacterium]